MTFILPVAPQDGLWQPYSEDAARLLVAFSRAGLTVSADECELRITGAAHFIREVAPGGPLAAMLVRVGPEIARMTRYAHNYTLGAC